MRHAAHVIALFLIFKLYPFLFGEFVFNTTEEHSEKKSSDFLVVTIFSSLQLVLLLFFSSSRGQI